ncbi:MAG: multidrug effflux MFS transporter [Gemmobacter sp.]
MSHVPAPPPVRFLDRTSPPHIATLVLMAGVSALSMNVFLPSLPAMAVWFDAPYAVIQLSLSAYLALSAILQLVIGPLSDRFGRRRVMLAAGGVFLVATLGATIAPTVEMFLICRMAQAAIVAGMVLGRAIVRDMVPEAQAASMIGYVTMGMSLVPMVAPLIGGVLDESFGWQANFVLMFVAGAAVLALVWADQGETAVRAHVSFRAQIRSYPDLLASRRFWGYAVCAAAGSAAFFSFLGGAPLVGARVFGLSPAELGGWFAAPAIGYLLGNYLSGRFAVRFGVVPMVLSGTLILTGATGLLIAGAMLFPAEPAAFFAVVTLIGVGNGLSLPSANAGMMSVRPDLAGSAAGLGGALVIGGGAAVSALAGPLLALGSTALPLALLMFSTSVMALVAILAVIRRNRRLGL